MKNGLLLEHYFSPDELVGRLTEWVDYYNCQRYNESVDNVRPADAYWGRQEQILAQRQKIKQLTVLKPRKSHIFNESKVAKTLSSLFIHMCPLLANDVHWQIKHNSMRHSEKGRFP